MAKPTRIVDPKTGVVSWTKHPEKLLARKQVVSENGQLTCKDDSVGIGWKVIGRYSFPHTQRITA
jgi:hypothetical protein